MNNTYSDSSKKYATRYIPPKKSQYFTIDTTFKKKCVEFEPYSWGEFYETTKACDGYSEEERKKFAIFEALDDSGTLQEVKNLVDSLSQDQINWLNSECLDGIILSISFKDDEYELDLRKLLSQNKEYFDTYKFFFIKGLIRTIIKDRYFYLYYGGLTLACEKGHYRITKFILDSLEIDSCDKGRAMGTAALENRIEIVQLLLQYGADIHFNIDQALRTSCEDGYIDIVRLLLKNGAYINGDATDRAYREGHTEILKLLEEHESQYVEYSSPGDSDDSDYYDIID